MGYKNNLDKGIMARDLNILVELSDVFRSISESLAEEVEIAVSVGSSTVTYAKKQSATQDKPATVTIDLGSSDKNEEAGLALQDSGKWACESLSDGRVSCERVTVQK